MITAMLILLLLSAIFAGCGRFYRPLFYISFALAFLAVALAGLDLFAFRWWRWWSERRASKKRLQ